MVETLLIVLMILVALPYSVYISVKLGTYAFFRGRQLYHEEMKDGEKKN